MSRQRRLPRPRPTRRSDRLHRHGGGRHGHQLHVRTRSWRPARPGWTPCGGGYGDAHGPGCSSWSGPTRRSTPGTGCPTRWRRPVVFRSSRSPVPARAGSPGRRSCRTRRRHDLHAVRIRPRGRSGAGPGAPGPSRRPRASVASSPSTPTRTSPVPAHGWSRAWSCSRGCCTAPRIRPSGAQVLRP